MNKTIDLTPTWEAADAAISNAQEDLLKLARYVDKLQAEKINEPSC